MKITVTEKDIKLGSKYKVSQTLCPIARAIRRAKLGVNIKVGAWTIWSKYGDVQLPKIAITAIEYMCNGIGMTPFSFNLTKEQVKTLKGAN